MSKIIIYGAGKMFQENVSRIDFSEVVCIADEKLFMAPIYGCNIIRKERIMEFEFDYVVIFNKWNTKEIAEDLVKIGVDANKIVHWAYYLYVMKYHMPNISEDSMFILKNWFENHKGEVVLDIDGSMTFNCLQMSGKQIVGNLSRVDNYETGRVDLIDKRLYEYSGTELKKDIIYDSIICLDYFLYHTYAEWKEFFVETFERSRYMIISVPYRGFNPNDNSWDDWEISENEIVSKASYNMVQIFIIDKHKHNANLKIYVVTHKPFIPPKDDMYVPVYAGAGSDNPMGIQGERVTDNIADLNLWINECTILYWIWKHTDEPYIGLNHYRRYFSLTNVPDYDNIIKAADVIENLRKYDMLVAPLYDSYPFSLQVQMEVSVNKEAFEKGFYQVRSVIEKKYPEYIKEFDVYFKGHYMYPCNMFITNRTILNQYCSWLFDILPDACANFDVYAYDGYSQRMIGFMAERLLTLWIIHNNISVKEIPMVCIE